MIPLDDDESTIEPPHRGTDAHGDATEVPVLLVAWLEGDPGLVGSVLFPSAEPSVFGRGAGAGDEARLMPMRQVPGTNLPLPPPTAPWMSRRQLRVQRLPDLPDGRGPGFRVMVENLGRSALRVRGNALGSAAAGRDSAAQAVVTPGDLIAVGESGLLLVTSRPRVLLSASAWSEPLQPLGDPDALGMVGESAAMWELRDRIAFTARQRGHVLVLGPSGSGKERVAQALHALSANRARALVARNAATIPTALMDVELFGHAASYPNPGMRERAGLVGEADGSTLFLDEIGELPEEMQAHLLRLMDSGEYQRLGEARARKADLRLVAATNRDPMELKADLRARFRHVLRVPPLAERCEDLPLLLRHLLRGAAGEDPQLATSLFTAERDADGRPVEPRVDLDVVAAILRHPLPLQVRELESLLWHAIATTMRSANRSRLHAPPALAASLDATAPPTTTAPHELGKDELQAALDRHEGRLERVWRDLGLKNRYVLRRLLEKHGLRGARDDD